MRDIQAPELGDLFGELKGVVDFPRLFLNAPELLRWRNRLLSPKVLVLPGYGTDDRSTYIMRQFLTLAGAEVWGWGLGKNQGNVNSLVPQLVEKVTQMYQQGGEKIHLVGWSLGGVLAREIAREVPDKVAQVVTLGSPIVGGPKYTVYAGSYVSRGIDMDVIEQEIDERNQKKIAVPLTVVYGKEDRIVAWKACVDHVNKQARHIEVRSTHFSMGFAPEVLELLAASLAEWDDVSV